MRYRALEGAEDRLNDDKNPMPANAELDTKYGEGDRGCEAQRANFAGYLTHSLTEMYIGFDFLPPKLAAISEIMDGEIV